MRNSNRNIDGGWGWMVVVGAHSLRALSHGVIYSCGPFIVEWLEHFGQSAAVTSWIFSLASLVTAIFSLFIGDAAVKFGIRPVVILGGLFLFAGFFFSVFAKTIAHLFITIGVMIGIGIGMTNVPSLLIVGVYFKKKINVAHGLVMVGACTGQLIFVTLFAYLNREYGWRGTSLIFAAITANAIACGFIFRPLEQVSRCREPGKDVKGDLRMVNLIKKEALNSSINKPCAAKEKPSKLRCHCLKNMVNISAVNICMNNPKLVLYEICMLCHGTGAHVVLAHLVNKAVVNGINKESAAMLMTITAVGGTLSRAGHGWFIDKGIASAQALYLMASLFCAVETLTFALTNIYNILAVLSFFFGFHHGILAGLGTFLPRLLVTQEQVPSAIGLTYFVLSIGNVVGPVLAGVLYDKTGNYISSFCFGACTFGLLSILFTPIYWFLRKKSTMELSA